MHDETSPARIEHALTLDILRGRYAPGSRLPPVRELAALNGVNPGTIQRVVARLEARGLVTALHGSGLRVNDPGRTGDLALLPDWLEASLDDPDRAAAILEELLDVRRALAVRLLVRHREAVLARLPALEGEAQRVLAATVAGDDGAAVRDADLDFARALMAATGHRVAPLVLNTVARVLAAVPAVSHAMYAEPAANVASMVRALQHLREPAGLTERLEALLEAIDRATVERFRDSLRRGVSP